MMLHQLTQVVSGFNGLMPSFVILSETKDLFTINAVMGFLTR